MSKKREGDKIWRDVVPLCFKIPSSKCFCILPKEKSAGSSLENYPVYLNVYDLTPINGYLFWAGLGVFHTGIEVHGVEYAFGSHDYPMSGIFEVEPRECPGFRFRKSIYMGTTCFDQAHVRAFMEEESTNYYGDTYNLIAKNCNHFCEDICYKLTGTQIPRWINRLAKLGLHCNFMLPDSLKASFVQSDPYLQAHENDKKRKRATSSRFCSIFVPQRRVSLSSFFLSTSYKGHRPPWESKKHGQFKKGGLKEEDAGDL